MFYSLKLSFIIVTVGKVMTISLVLAALFFCGTSVYSFCKANYCACTRAGECDNPVNYFWLSAIVNALIALLLCCVAVHSKEGTILWLILMASCFTGAVISAKNSKRRCEKSKIKPKDALLINEPD